MAHGKRRLQDAAKTLIEELEAYAKAVPRKDQQLVERALLHAGTVLAAGLTTLQPAEATKKAVSKALETATKRRPKKIVAVPLTQRGDLSWAEATERLDVDAFGKALGPELEALMTDETFRDHRRDNGKSLTRAVESYVAASVIAVDAAAGKEVENLFRSGTFDDGAAGVICAAAMGQMALAMVLVAAAAQGREDIFKRLLPLAEIAPLAAPAGGADDDDDVWFVLFA